MSSVRLRELLQTTGFRLALLFGALFGAASLLLFGVLYSQTVGYLRTETDEWLAREGAKIVDSTPAERLRLLNEHSARDPEAHHPFAVFDADGKPLAGNLASIPVPVAPLDSPFDFTLQRNGRTAPVRGLAHRLPSGELVLVSQDVHEMNEFGELLVRAMAWGGLLIFIVGLAGAAITGAAAVRRLDDVIRAIERIVSGDLSGRLPTRGRSGDLERLVHVVNVMLDDLERLMHEVKGVCDGIAHDMRTPLTRLLAGLERARRRETSAEEYALSVDEAIVELKGILSTFSAMLRISEVEDGARRAGFTSLNLARVAGDVRDFYEPLAEEKDISLSLATEGEEGVELRGDPSLIFEALSNLVDNALKFTPSGGRVTVHTAQTHARIGIAVSDTGSGIPVEEREAVLRRFHRTEKSRHTPGNGLGLSLVAAVARLHGLSLVIEDARPGCRVTLVRGGATPDAEANAAAR